jgi:hypothetical protein
MTAAVVHLLSTSAVFGQVTIRNLEDNVTAAKYDNMKVKTSRVVVVRKDPSLMSC